MASPMLSMDRVTARLHGRPVLDAVSLRLERGQTLALLGPAGAGKTAILLALAGFLRLTSGSIRLADRDITAAAPETRDIAMAFDTDALFPHLPVLDNVAFGLKMRGVPRAARRAQALAALQVLGISGLAGKPPARLDPVERRLVALARAAVTHPALLLVDEPAASDASASREDARAVLRAALGPDHTTAILATHDRAAAFALAERVALLRDGRLEQQGTPQDLFDRPATRFAATFTGACNLLPAILLHERDGAAVVNVAGVTAAACCPPGIAAGPVTLCIRPHRVRAGAGGKLRGVVERADFQGALTHITLGTQAGQCLVETAQPPPGLAPGVALGLDWDGTDAWAIPPEAAS